MLQRILTVQVSSHTQQQQNDFLLTKASFAEESISILQSSRPPSRVAEVIIEKFQHNSLFFMPCRLFPKSVDQFNFAQSEIEKRARCGVTIVARHVFIARYHLQVCFLWEILNVKATDILLPKKKRHIPSIPPS